MRLRILEGRRRTVERQREGLRSSLSRTRERLDRYTLELDIVSVALEFTAEGDDRAFPLLEVLDIQIVDRHTGRRHHGIVGNNFSSYVRDYDFSVLLPAARDASNGPAVPADFGDLHGKLGLLRVVLDQHLDIPGAGLLHREEKAVARVDAEPRAGPGQGGDHADLQRLGRGGRKARQQGEGRPGGNGRLHRFVLIGAGNSRRSQME